MIRVCNSTLQYKPIEPPLITPPSKHIGFMENKNSSPDVIKKRVGLIGLGAMGRGTALNLISKGFEVFGYDVRAESLEWLKDSGGVPVGSLHELASHVQTVLSFVINSAQTESVLYGENGLVGKLSAGSIFIASSTMDPAYVEDLAQRLVKDSIRLIDSPVTGGPEGALKGSLTIMGSGEAATFAEVKPLLEAMGGRVYYLGLAGAGSKLKVVNQMLVGANLAAAAEAIALAKHLGLPMKTTHEALSSGAASSWMLVNRGGKMISENFDDVTATVDILLKDLSLVLDATRNIKFTASLAHVAYLKYLEASAKGLGLKDISVITKSYS